MSAARRYGTLSFVTSLGTLLALGRTTDIVTLDRWGVVRALWLALVMGVTMAALARGSR